MENINTEITTTSLTDAFSFDLEEENTKNKLPTPPKNQSNVAEKINQAMISIKSELEKEGKLKSSDLQAKVHLIENLVNAIQGRNLNLGENKQLFKQERDRLLRVVQQIRNAQDRDSILARTVAAVRDELQATRVLIYRFESDTNGKVVMESVLNGWTPAQDETLPCLSFGLQKANDYQKQPVIAIADTHKSKLTPYQIQLLEKFQVKAFVALPIMLHPDRDGDRVWGLLVVQQCSQAHQWREVDINFIYQITTELTVALQPSELSQGLAKQIERERATTQIIQNIQQSNDVYDIFRTATQKARQLLEADRVVVYRFNPDWSGEVLAESLGSGWVSVMEIQKVDQSLYSTEMGGDDRCTLKDLKAGSTPAPDTYLQKTKGGEYVKGKQFQVVNDVYAAGFSPCYLQSLEKYQAKAYIIVPIFQKKKLWGLFAAYQNSAPRNWQQSDLSLMMQLANPLGVAIQQAEFIEELKTKAEQEQATNKIAERIRQSLNLNDIFRTATQEVRQILAADRVVVYRFNPDWSGEVLAESVGANWVSVMEIQKIDKTLYSVEMNADERCTLKDLKAGSTPAPDTYLQKTKGGEYVRGKQFQVVNDVDQAGFSPCYLESLRKYQAKAYVIVPIFQKKKLWGLFAAYQNSGSREWKQSDVNLMMQLSTPLGVAIQQAEFIEELQSKAQQEQAIDTIIDRIRQSLDLNDIFRTATAEVRKVLEADRVVVYRFNSDWSGEVIAESVGSQWISVMQLQKNDQSLYSTEMSADSRCTLTSLQASSALDRDTYFRQTQGGNYARGKKFQVVNDVYAVGFSPCYLESLEKYQAKAYVIVPIFQNNELKGLFAAYQNNSARNWQKSDLNLMLKIAPQLSFALQQASYMRQIQGQSEQLKRTVEREKGLARLLDRMQQAKNQETVFSTACQEARKFLEVDRVAIYRFKPDWSSEFISESAVAGCSSLMGNLPVIKDTLLQETQGKLCMEKDAYVVEDIYSAGFELCFIELLERFEAQAYMMIPIHIDEKLWGLACAFYNRGARIWEKEDVNALKQVAVQISLTLQRIDFLEQLRIQSANLAETLEREKAAKDKLKQQAVAMLTSVRPAFKGDLTVRATVTEDEIGTIAAAYNTTLDSLRDIVVQVKTAVEQVAQTTNNSNDSIKGLSTQAQQQFQELDRALTQIEQMLHSSEVTTKNAKQVEIAIDRANQTVKVGDKAMNNTVESILGIRQTVAEASKGVKRLSDSSQKISRVVSLISSFAAQTNLLALNAALEATRAGEYGKGFAVVADEVRNLSLQSTEATSEIEKLVQEIQNETQTVAAAMETGIQQVVEGTSLVNETRESLNAIVTATTEIGELVEGITHAATAQTHQAESITKVMTGVAAIANSTSEDSLQISHSFQELLKMAQDLQSSIAQFKIN